ncbi:phosphoribosyl-ATP diphosphatase [uncultured Jannaschia sp.]|uniref:phosphoribosyl-ATP diphosphatase n=1 Tax=uncultured Jannaschia sp. TaxID=293347 RepID=UPI002634EF61|nr:phosphoribosyl-ATP diphosphatase [uncultured Jannaschia sp.]
MHPLDALWQTVQSRRDADPEKSWTAKLLSRGPAKCAEKFGEEAVETLIEAVRGDREKLAEEGADLLYHFCVMLAAADVDLADVMARLEARAGVSGITEKAARPD